MESKDQRRSSGIGDRLRMARESRGLSQAELSTLASVDRKTCHQIETGKGAGNVGVLTLEKLADALDIPAAWLAFGLGDSQSQVADLTRELAEVKQERTALAGKVQQFMENETGENNDYSAEDDFDDGEEEDEDEDGDQDEDDQDDKPPPEAVIAWPNSYRLLGVEYKPLPPLGRHYAPVLEALGPSLPRHKRLEVSQQLMMLVSDDQDLVRTFADRLDATRSLLAYLVPPRHHRVVDLVMSDLESRDSYVRIKMCLSLMIDAGLPIDYDALSAARHSYECYGKRRGLFNAAMEILDMQERRIKLLLDRPHLVERKLLPSAEENIPQLDGA